MKITDDCLRRIVERDAFRDFYCSYAAEFSEQYAKLRPRFSARRLFDAHHFWTEDVKRLRDFSLNKKEPDHFKQSGHLAYWLRRSNPIVDYDVLGSANAEEEENRKLLFDFGGEYLAFDLGYMICRHYETSGLLSGTYPNDFNPGTVYVRDVCCFLKEKNVSPHALYLIYKSLLLKRFIQYET